MVIPVVLQVLWQLFSQVFPSWSVPCTPLLKQRFWISDGNRNLPGSCLKTWMPGPLPARAPVWFWQAAGAGNHCSKGSHLSREVLGPYIRLAALYFRAHSGPLQPSCQNVSRVTYTVHPKGQEEALSSELHLGLETPSKHKDRDQFFQH